MRTIILGLMGATMLGSVAQAACNDIPNPTRFNPTELSQYQECWLDTYEEDNAGVLGSLAWIRLNGEYFSAPISLIRKMKGSNYADKFFAAIEPELIEVVERQTQERIVEIETIIEYVDVIIEDTKRIDELEKELKTLKEIDIPDLKQMIADKDEAIAELVSDLNNHKNWLAHRIKQGETAVSYLSRIYNHVDHYLNPDDHHYAPSADGTFFSGADFQYIIDVVTEMKAAAAGVPDQTVIPVSSSQGDINHALALTGATAGDHVRIDGVTAPGNPIAGHIDYVRVNDDDNIWNIAGSIEQFNNLFPLYDDEDMISYYDLPQVQAFINSSDLDYAIGAAAAAAYTDGYDSGYRDGYNDGYADGVAGRDPVNNS